MTAMVAAVNTGPPSTLLYFFMILATGGVLNLAWQAYMRHKRGGTEDDELVSRISNQVVEGAHGLLEEYRIEIEVAKRRIEDYQRQITELNRFLGAANERINRLEAELESGRGERASLQHELAATVERREQMRRKVEELEHQIALLREEIHTH